MHHSERLNRRTFLAKTARLSAAGLVFPSILPSGALGRSGNPGANGRIQVGLIGCGAQGQAVLRRASAHPDVVVTGACDVFKSRRDRVVSAFKETCKSYADFRDLLAQPSVDAVIIASPPHWHLLMAVMAMEAGKDVYLEKPMTLHLGEDIALRNAVRQTQRICQVGTQMHALENFRQAVEVVRAGYLGQIGTVRAFHVLNRGPTGVGRQDQGTVAPADLDWDLWCGPAPLAQYNSILVAGNGNCNSWMDYGGGWTAGMGPHILDLPVWALDLPYPSEVSASGGRFIISDDGDAYDNHEVLWRYPKLTMAWMSSLTNSYGFDLHGRPSRRRRLGIYFHGTFGTMWSNYEGNRIVPEDTAMNEFIKPDVVAKKQAPDYPVRAMYNIPELRPVEQKIPLSPGHEFEWIECIKTRQAPSCAPDYHSRINVPIALSHLSLKLGRSLRFDPTSQQIIGDPEATRLSVPQYRSPWSFPSKYLGSRTLEPRAASAPITHS